MTWRMQQGALVGAVHPFDERAGSVCEAGAEDYG